MFHSFIEGEYKEAIIERAPQNRWLDDPVERVKREEERFQVQIPRRELTKSEKREHRKQMAVHKRKLRIGKIEIWA